jgi:lipoteichoic acid synthase
MIVGVLFISYSILFNRYKKYKRWQYNDLANPVTFFFESALQSDQTNLLFSMEGAGDFEDLPANNGNVIPVSFPDSSEGVVKNVVVFVLESVPAEYLDSYGGKFAVTPEINKLIPSSIRFTNTYAHSPATNNSMVSILSSVYPWISYKSLTKEHPQIKLNPINTLLKRQGYRTAFYSAGDLKYQRGNEFLSQHQFDQIEDFSSKRCREKQFIVNGLVQM